MYHWQTDPSHTSPKPQKVCITLFSGEEYDGDWPPEDSVGFLSWFEEKVSQVDSEHRSTIRIELGSNSGYEGSHYASIEISYTRKETSDEVLQRIANWRAACEAQEREERAAYQALQAKFG